MICDDNRDILSLFGKALKSKYNVILTGSGEDCIDKFIEQTDIGIQIDVLLLDYKLQDTMLGDKVAHKIKEFNDRTKTILISAFNVDEVLLRELEESNSIVRFIRKPIHLRHLIELIDQTVS
jgi:CheY-like chemotaxis protein